MSKLPPAVDAWIRKAENDFKNIRATLVRADPAWDTVCFHAQQAAEKYLKATGQEIDYCRLRKTFDSAAAVVTECNP